MRIIEHPLGIGNPGNMPLPPNTSAAEPLISVFEAPKKQDNMFGLPSEPPLSGLPKKHVLVRLPWESGGSLF